jgi:protein-tyrosine phosphatase
MTDFCINAQVSAVPDPYYGGNQGFENVLDLLEDACQGLLEFVTLKKT